VEAFSGSNLSGLNAALGSGDLVRGKRSDLYGMAMAFNLQMSDKKMTCLRAVV